MCKDRRCMGNHGGSIAGLAMLVLLASLLALSGCNVGPQFVPESERHAIDRKLVEYPKSWVLKTAARGLTAPEAIAFVTDEGEYKGSLLVAESGQDLKFPRIYGWKPDGTFFTVYPKRTQ